MTKLIKVNTFSVMTMLQGFDKSWGARGVLCRRHNLHINETRKGKVDRWVGSFLSLLAGGMGVVLG